MPNETNGHKRPSSSFYIQTLNLTAKDLGLTNNHDSTLIPLAKVTGITNSSPKASTGGNIDPKIAPELQQFILAHKQSSSALTPKEITRAPSTTILYSVLKTVINADVELRDDEVTRSYQRNSADQITIYESVYVYESNKKDLASDKASYIVTSKYSIKYIASSKNFKIIPATEAQLFLNFIMLQPELSNFFEIANDYEYFSNLTEAQLLEGLLKFVAYEEKNQKESTTQTAEFLFRKNSAKLAMRALCEKYTTAKNYSISAIKEVVGKFPANSFLKLALSILEIDELFAIITEQNHIQIPKLPAKDTIETTMPLATVQQVIPLSVVQQVIQEMTEFPDVGVDTSKIVPELYLCLWAQSTKDFAKKMDIAPPLQKAIDTLAALSPAKKIVFKKHYTINDFNQITIDEHIYNYEESKSLSLCYITTSKYVVKFSPEQQAFEISSSTQLFLNPSFLTSEPDEFLASTIKAISEQQVYIPITELSPHDFNSYAAKYHETQIPLTTVQAELTTASSTIDFDVSSITPELQSCLRLNISEKMPALAALNLAISTNIYKVTPNKMLEIKKSKKIYKIDSFDKITVHEQTYFHEKISEDSESDSIFPSFIFSIKYTIQYLPEGYFKITTATARLSFNPALVKHQLEKFFDAANQLEYFSNLSNSQLVAGLLSFVNYEKENKAKENNTKESKAEDNAVEENKTLEFFSRKAAAIIAMQILYARAIQPYLKTSGSSIIKSFSDKFPENSFLKLISDSIEDKEVFKLITPAEFQTITLFNEISTDTLKEFTEDSIKLLGNIFQFVAGEQLENFVAGLDFEHVHEELQRVIFAELSQKKLKSLSIKNSKILDDTTLMTILENSKDSLEMLVINNCPITDSIPNRKLTSSDSSPGALTYLASFTELQELQILDCNELEKINANLRSKATNIVIADCRKVQSLTINGVSLKNISIFSCGNLSSLHFITPEVKSINIHDCNAITDQELLSKLNDLKTLEIHNFSGCEKVEIYQNFNHKLISQFPNEDLEFAYSVLLQVLRSKAIIIENKALTENQINIINTILTNNLEVHTLKLINCNLQGQRFIPIGNAIVENTHLREVSLKGNYINSIELETYINEWITKLASKNITDLDLSDNTLDISKHASILYAIPSLRKLDLTNNTISLEQLNKSATKEIKSLDMSDNEKGLFCLSIILKFFKENFHLLELKLPKIKKKAFGQDEYLELDLDNNQDINRKIKEITNEFSDKIALNNVLLNFFKAIENKNFDQVKEIFASQPEARKLELLTKDSDMSGNKAIHIAMASGDEQIISFIVNEMLERELDLQVLNSNKESAFTAKSIIKRLNLNAALSEPATIQLFKTLTFCKQVHTLVLLNTIFTIKNLEALIKWLQSQTQLVKLRINENLTSEFTEVRLLKIAELNEIDPRKINQIKIKMQTISTNKAKIKKLDQNLELAEKELKILTETTEPVEDKKLSEEAINKKRADIKVYQEAISQSRTEIEDSEKTIKENLVDIDAEIETKTDKITEKQREINTYTNEHISSLITEKETEIKKIYEVLPELSTEISPSVTLPNTASLKQEDEISAIGDENIDVRIKKINNLNKAIRETNSSISYSDENFKSVNTKVNRLNATIRYINKNTIQKNIQHLKLYIAFSEKSIANLKSMSIAFKEFPSLLKMPLDGEGNTALHLAVLSGEASICKFIFSEIYRISQILVEEDKKPQETEQKAEQQKQLQFLRDCFQTLNHSKKTALELTDTSGNTMLHWAAANGDPGTLNFVIEQMLSQNLTLEAKNNKGATAFKLSKGECRALFESHMLKLIFSKPKLNSEDVSKICNTLMVCDRRIIFSLDNNQFPQHLDEQTAEMVQFIKFYHAIATNSLIELKTFSANFGGDSSNPLLMKLDSLGNTALHWAMQGQNEEVTSFLIEQMWRNDLPLTTRNANRQTVLELTEQAGNTLLHRAAMGKDPDFLKYIIVQMRSQNLSLENLNKNKQTAFAVCSKELKPLFASYLFASLLSKENITATDLDNAKIYLEMSCQNADLRKIIEIIDETKNYIVALAKATEPNEKKNIANVINENIHLIKLYRALQTQSLEELRNLTEYLNTHTHLFEMSMDGQGNTALHLAVLSQNMGVFAFIVDQMCKHRRQLEINQQKFVNEEKPTGKTPLDLSTGEFKTILEAHKNLMTKFATIKFSPNKNQVIADVISLTPTFCSLIKFTFEDDHLPIIKDPNSQEAKNLLFFKLYHAIAMEDLSKLTTLFSELKDRSQLLSGILQMKMDCFGNVALHRAVLSGNQGIIGLVIDQMNTLKLDLKIKNNKGQAAPHLANHELKIFIKKKMKEKSGHTVKIPRRRSTTDVSKNTSGSFDEVSKDISVSPKIGEAPTTTPKSVRFWQPPATPPSGFSKSVPQSPATRWSNQASTNGFAHSAPTPQPHSLVSPVATPDKSLQSPVAATPKKTLQSPIVVDTTKKPTPAKSSVSEKEESLGSHSAKRSLNFNT